MPSSLSFISEIFPFISSFSHRISSSIPVSPYLFTLTTYPKSSLDLKLPLLITPPSASSVTTTQPSSSSYIARSQDPIRKMLPASRPYSSSTSTSTVTDMFLSSPQESSTPTESPTAPPSLVEFDKKRQHYEQSSQFISPLASLHDPIQSTLPHSVLSPLQLLIASYPVSSPDIPQKISALGETFIKCVFSSLPSDSPFLSNATSSFVK